MILKLRIILYMSESKIIQAQGGKKMAIHTRKEAIGIFEELKNKINIAYESMTQQSFQMLLTIVKAIFYLYPTPNFLREINQIASIPVTTFLENLLIKTHMTKLKLMGTFKNWVITLLLKFNQTIPNLKIENIKEIKEKKYQLYQDWNGEIILSFIKNGLEISVKRRDVGIVSVLVHFMRVYIIYEEHNKRFVINKQDQKWKPLIFNLVEGSKILDNLKKEEIAVCICYYLCTKQKSLCIDAVQSGVIEYLIQLLQRDYISAPFGKKIIEFMKFLMLHLDCRFLSQINVPAFERALGSFSSKFQKEDIIITIRDLINIFQQKIAVMDYQQKIETLGSIYSQLKSKSSLPQSFFEVISIINLYIHNDRMGNLLVKNYEALFQRILLQQNSPYLIKMISGFLAFNFKKGKFESAVALEIIGKVSKTIENNNFRQILLQDRKKVLIDFIKIIKMLLSNREHHQKVVEGVHNHHLQYKFWSFSDCTNYMYQKQLIQFQRMLGHKQSGEFEAKQVEVLTKLQEDIINKSRFNLNKLSWQLYEEVKFLENLINDNKNLSKNFKPSPEIAVVVSNYIQTTNHKSSFALLQNIQNEDNQLLRKEFNLICTKLLTKLLKQDTNSAQMKKVKQKMISLTTSKDEIDDIYDMINNFFEKEEVAHVEYEQKMEILRASLRQQTKVTQQNELVETIKLLLYQYFRTDQHFDISLLNMNSEQDLYIILQELSNYQNEGDIIKYLKMVYQLCKKDNACIQIYRILSVNLMNIYQALIARKEGNDEQVVILLQTIFLKFIKYHLKNLFQDNYDPNSTQFYFQIVGEIDTHFDFGFTNKRIELLQLIIEYFDCNMIESHSEYEKLIKKQNRSELIRTFIDNNNAQSIGLSYGKLIFLNSDDEVHEAFWMQHKQHIIRCLYDTRQNIGILKFIQIYLTECQRFIFKEYQLQNLIEIIVELAVKEVEDAENLMESSPSVVLKLRKFKYIGLVLESFIEREDLRANKNLLYSEQEIIIRIMLHLLEFYRGLAGEQNQSFKKFYIEQIIQNMVTILTKLYKNNFIDKEIRGEYLVNFLEQLMQTSNQNIITKACELMHVFLLKKFVSMIECRSFHTCKEYISSLPLNAQTHIQACMRIEDALPVDQSLEEEIKGYFLASPQQEEQLNNSFQNFSKNFYVDEDQDVPPKTQLGQGSIPVELAQQKGYQQNELILHSVEEVQESLEQTNLGIKPEIKFQKQVIEQKQEQKQLQVWSEQQLLQNIKKFLANNSYISLKQIAKRLIDLQSAQYCHLLMELYLHSDQLYQRGFSPIVLSLQQVQQAIIKHIPCGCCPLDNKYYQIIQKNSIGSGICLRKKGGFKATEILCKKLSNTQDEKQFYQHLQALVHNLSSLNEIKYINSIKLHECINSKAYKALKDEEKLSTICRFIKHTTQLPQMRGNYQIAPQLVQTLIDSDFNDELKNEVIQALAGMTFDCHKNKKIAQSTKIVAYLNTLLKQKNPTQNLFVSSAKLLANIIDYSQTLITQTYHSLGLQDLILKILSQQVGLQKCSSLLTSCLKVLDFLSRNAQSSAKIVKGNFSSLLLAICNLSKFRSENYQNIGYQINILFNIYKTHESSLLQNLGTLKQQKIIEFFVMSSPYVPKIKKSEPFFQMIGWMIPLGEIARKFMEKNSILSILCQILKQGEFQVGIIEKWVRIICQMFQIPKFLYAPQILKSNIFYLAANCLKLNSFLTENTMTMSIKLMKSLNAIEDPDNLLIRHGFVDFMIQILKMKNLQTEDYIAMLVVMKRLQDKSIFPPHLSTKIFEIVIKNLQNHWKDQIAVNSIILLKKIKKNVEITTEFSHNMFEFFNKFLTQGSKINTYEYYSISREVICLISYFVNFNEDVKSMFRGKVIIDILKNWLKIFKNLSQEESPQTYRLWLYSVYNQKTFHYDTCSISNVKLAEIQARFEKGWKCNLFRMDGSYKAAMIKYKVAAQQIQAFKFPDGEVKSKYKLPLKNILLTYRYSAEKDLLFEQSRFKRTINPFQHTVNPLNCLTIFCLMQQRYQVKQISVQMQNKMDLQQIYSYLKIILNKMLQEQKEQEIKLWKIKSSRQSPIK